MYEGPEPGKAVWRTDDGGGSWHPVGIPGEELNGYCIALDPVSDSLLYAGVSNGIYRSDDAGINWTYLGLERPVIDIAICPDSTNIIIASTPRTFGSQYNDLMLSQQGIKDGIKWDFGNMLTAIPLALPNPAHSPGNDEPFIFSESALMRSVDGGVEWESLSLTGIFVTNIVVNPANPEILYAAGYRDSTNMNRLNLYRTTDRGDSWDVIFSPDYALGLHVLESLHNALALHPVDSSAIYVGTLTGLQTSKDGGSSFSVTGVPLNTYRLASSNRTPGRFIATSITPMFGGILAEGFAFMKESAEAGWTMLIDDKRPSAVVRYHPSADGEAVLGSPAKGLFRSTDDGFSWEDISCTGKLNVFDVELDPLAAGLIYTVHGDIGTYPPGKPEVRRSTDSGGNWETIWEPDNQIFCFELHPQDSELFYAGLYPSTMMKSTDGGDSWQPVEYFNDMFVKAIGISPYDQGEICAGTRQSGLHVSTDAGISWFQADYPESTSVTSITYGSPDYPFIFVATDAHGIWFSMSISDSFSELNNGLHSMRSLHLTVDSLGENKIYAGTSRGVFEMDLTTLGIIGDGNKGPGISPLPTVFLDQNFPNPFNPTTTIVFHVPGIPGEKQNLILTIYDLRGRRVSMLVDSEMEAGRHRITWNGRNDRGEPVSSGNYFCTLRAGDTVHVRKMVVLR
jgi:photosystem II stability/assembly factor-like uncharacterized protein